MDSNAILNEELFGRENEALTDLEDLGPPSDILEDLEPSTRTGPQTLDDIQDLESLLDSVDGPSPKKRRRVRA